MYRKAMTQECKNCALRWALGVEGKNKDAEQYCTWGKAKKEKLLQGNGKGKHCKLIAK